MYLSVLITGSIGYDTIMDYPDKFISQIQIDKIHQLNLSFVVDRFERQLGGIATNISYNLSLLRPNIKVKVFGAVGKDGEELIEFFKKNQINTRGIIRDKKLFSANGSVITDIKDNQIWSYCYGASVMAKKIKLLEHFNKTTMMTISSTHKDAMINFQKQAIKSKIDYLYDPGLALGVIPRNILHQGVKNCKWLVGNDYEIGLIQKILNLSVNQLVDFGVKVITTLGEKGVCYKDKNNQYFIPAYKVKKVVDPTGAGDAWRGGFIAGICQGKSIKDCLKLGNVLASFAIEKYGTVNHKPSKEDVNKRLKHLNNY